MGEIKTAGRRAWRRYVVDGVPSSGEQMPLKSEILPFVDKVDEVVETIRHGLAETTASVEELGTAVQAVEALVDEIDPAMRVVVRATWAQLAEVTALAGQPAVVIGPDAGTHTDPVTGEAGVSNLGSYLGAPIEGGGLGWWRVGDSNVDGLNTRLTAAEGKVVALEGKTAELQSAPLDRRDGGFDFVVEDENSRAAIATDADGVTQLGGLRLRARSPDPRDGDPFIFAIGTDRHRVMLGWDRDYKAHLQLADGVGGGGYESPEAIGGSLDIIEARTLPDGGRALLIRDGQQTVSVRTTRLGPPTGLVESVLPVEVLHFDGQSNAGNNGSAVPAIQQALWPHHVVSLDGRVSAWGSTAVDTSAIAEIAPLRDRSTADEVAGSLFPGQYLATMSAFAQADLDRRLGRIARPYAVWTAWYGGQPLSAFREGQTNFQNGVSGLARIKAVASGYGRTVVCRAVKMVQGEAGPFDRTDWASQLGDYAAEKRAAVADALGQGFLPALIYWQTAQNDITTGDANASAVRLAQYDVMVASGGTGIVLAGPMYPYPMADDIHKNDLGQMMQGELDALVYDIVRETGSFVPLSPVPGGATRSGAVITLPMRIPAGSGPLAWDYDWVAPVAHYGFRVTIGGTPVGFAAFVDGSSIKIVLDSDPGGGPVAGIIEYALDNATGDDGFSNGRGMLVSQTPVQSYYHQLGHAVPEFLRHWCVAFQETFT